MKDRITILDIIVTALIITLSVLLSISMIRGKSNDCIEIKSPTGTYIYPLSENAVYRIEGKIGISIICVQDGEVRFEDSPCPNKTCVTDGYISKPGEFLACLPNCISVTVTGKGGVDDVSF